MPPLSPRAWFSALAIYALAGALFLLMTGCATDPQGQIVTSRVPVPTPCPPPPETIRPALAIADLAPDSPPPAVLRAYVVAVEQLIGYARELEAALQGYAKPPAAPNVESPTP